MSFPMDGEFHSARDCRILLRLSTASFPDNRDEDGQLNLEDFSRSFGDKPNLGSDADACIGRQGAGELELPPKNIRLAAQVAPLRPALLRHLCDSSTSATSAAANSAQMSSDALRSQLCEIAWELLRRSL